jgi:phenylpropionate dioxygenase-like ring-hydroxylating dioxygenase large terminal subunit
VWQWACREEHIPNVGDYYVYDIGDRSVIVVRTSNGIRAYHNFCLHRGTQLRPSASTGWAKRFRCPFHGWTWDLDGKLVDLPCKWDFPHVDEDEFSLPEVRVGLWGGFVFVNFDDDAEPLEQYLGVLADHFERWDLADRYIEAHIRKQLPCNWKAAQEAFLEAYHVLETHSQAIMTTGDANAQYDVFPPHVTRFIHSTATPSPHVADPPDDQRILELIFGRKQPGADVPTLPEGWTAREVYAQYVQAAMGERYGRDFSNLTVAETIDSIEYFLFPNAFFFPGLALGMVYRFRPNGDDPDTCTFDLLMLRPKPLDRPAPAPPEPVDLRVEDSYTLVPALDPSLGHVYDQDTANLAAQTKGFKGSKKRGQTLGNYQEVRARFLHQRVHEYLTRDESMEP